MYRKGSSITDFYSRKIYITLFKLDPGFFLVYLVCNSTEIYNKLAVLFGYLVLLFK